MSVALKATRLVRVRAIDRAIEEAAVRLAEVTRRSIDQLVRLRGTAIAADVDAFRLRHRELEDDALGRALVRDTRWRSAARGAVSGVPSLFPGVGTAVALGVAIADAAATIHDQAALALALCHLEGLDVEAVEERRADLLLILGLESGGLRLKDGRLLAGDQEIGRDGVLDDEVLGRLSRGIGEAVVKRIATRRAGIAVGRLAPLGIGVAVAAGSDYRALSSAARATRRYLAWRASAAPAT